MTLTRELIEAATGRELDCLVHVHVHGLPENEMLMEMPFIAHGGGSTGFLEYLNLVKPYSTDGCEMLLVLDRLSELGFDTHIQRRSALYFADICHRGADVDHEGEDYPTWEAHSESLPEAVAKAALCAVLAQPDTQRLGEVERDRTALEAPSV